MQGGGPGLTGIRKTLSWKSEYQTSPFILLYFKPSSLSSYITFSPRVGGGRGVQASLCPGPWGSLLHVMWTAFS